MAIPNTTPTPNIIFNGLMAKMTDTEFRVVMAVVRATLGWELDNKTGMRKQEDWLSYWQLKKITGRGYAALAQAIESCIKKGWIEARDENGNILDTKNKRIGKKIFYRLGPEILLKNDENGIVVKTVPTSSESEEVIPTSSESEISESEISESEAYKINTIQKKNYTKNITKVIQKTAPSYGNEDINYLMKKFQELTGLKKLDNSEKQNRRYCWLLLKKFGSKENVEKLIKIALKDKFHQANLTSFKYLYYNGVRILNQLKVDLENPRFLDLTKLKQ